ncbi:MAG: histidine--tRNA ligase [Alphaproteobacteria bacterium]|nr:histidine--tRNA ligase [Alphaproteobacteria bacterium]MDE2014220.1 histidine--tRNA ligase [Alphaproteobacteria bacterium]
MSKDKPTRPKARLPRGFRDRSGAELLAERRMLDTIRRVYESYGFSALETPAFEYTDALGKFLPDVDRPNAGVFSLRDDDEQWMSLRYDLTAPLARYVAENFQTLPKPFRRYQVGPVWRNEKPGPGRYREFTQFDADTVGSNSPAADAELLMMVCDALEALGLRKGEYVVKINSRKFLDGVLEIAGISPEDGIGRGIVLRALDKLDRLGVEGVRDLLGSGRKDESGDFTRGAELRPNQIDMIMSFTISNGLLVSEIGHQGAEEIENILSLVRRYSDRVRFDPSIIRGLDYYTGPVFEAQLLFPVKNDAGEDVVFGSVAGGGRYDDLVARFTGQQVPATGISIGVSRLMSALMSRGRLGGEETPLVFVLTMDDAAASFAMARELREAGFRAETYVGTKRVPDQLKYADKRGAAIAVIEGSDERAKGEVTLKDLALGAEMAKTIESRAHWVKDRPAQITVPRADLVRQVRLMLERAP